MKPSSAIKICLGIVVSCVVCICGLNFSSTEDAENIKTLNKNVTQNYSRTAVVSRVESVGNGQDAINLPGIVPDLTDWLECCKECHKLWFYNGLRYSQSAATTTNFDGTTINVRPDCSGYTAFCLYTYGVNLNCELTDVWSGSSWESFGLNLVLSGPKTYDDLLPGDIAVWPGTHVQIYVGPTPENRWYDWGDTGMIERAYAGQEQDTADPISTLSSHSLDTCKVFRLSSP